MAKSKQTKVTLRTKPITGNRLALYLDYYPAMVLPGTTKATRREFLQRWIHADTEHQEETYQDKQGKPQRRIVPVLDGKGCPVHRKLTKVQQEENREAMLYAETLQAKRMVQVRTNDLSFLPDPKGEVCFIRYFRELADKRAGSNYDNWYSAFYYLQDFTEGEPVPFKELDEVFINEFREYLLTAPSRKSTKTGLAINSAVSYFNKVKATLKEAYKGGYLRKDLNVLVPGIEPEETHREFLTLDELRTLAATPCEDDTFRRAALFSCLTGLRFSDVEKLIWQEIEKGSTGGHVVRYRQKKTKGAETLPISEQALRLLGEQGASGEKVFTGLYYGQTETIMPRWLAAAGITRNITFHSFRHTFATLQIDLGTDLFTVSKMLGHKDIKTTQVYAKIMDKKKQEAAERITLNL